MAKQSEVVFTDTSKEVKKALEGLSKTALRESGKVARKKLREAVPMRTKRIKNHIASWAFIERATGQPQLQIGFYGRGKVKKRGKQPSHASPHWLEFGTKPRVISASKRRVLADGNVIYGKTVHHPGTPALNILRNAVFDNIGEIRKAQEEYLAKLSETIAVAQGAIVATEEVEDD